MRGAQAERQFTRLIFVALVWVPEAPALVCLTAVLSVHPTAGPSGQVPLILTRVGAQAA